MTCVMISGSAVGQFFFFCNLRLHFFLQKVSPPTSELFKRKVSKQKNFFFFFFFFFFGQIQKFSEKLTNTLDSCRRNLGKGMQFLRVSIQKKKFQVNSRLRSVQIVANDFAAGEVSSGFIAVILKKHITVKQKKLSDRVSPCTLR
eukprot:TRINITY_DN36574_c0_g1_i1.p2 TRINITY_DN36574_c0_g1~~TRINITY_DN36574_c0_g1_i1.p2  ORF type:complete len:145 (-),score=19.56 TRINITY_DN36574_c0_g1_i1:70-504(-)